MKKQIKDILRPLWLNYLHKRSQQELHKRIIDEWKKEGCPIPPPHVVKQHIVSKFQRKTGYSTLIETGTYLGEMVEAQKSRFKKIISIELSHDLFEKAQLQFEKDRHVTILNGDSGRLLPGIMSGINRPVIFWLDGHYSAGITAKGEKECPILEELAAIFENKRLNHVILIDDARLFTGQGDYPSIGQLTEFVESRNNLYKVEVEHDIIRCVKR